MMDTSINQINVIDRIISEKSIKTLFSTNRHGQIK